MKTAKDILDYKGTEVWHVSPSTLVFEALYLLNEKEVGALMVIDAAGRVAGIVSERDYARKVALAGKSSKETPVEEIMTPREDLYKIKPATSIEDCLILMAGKKIRHLPVFEGDNFLGIISMGDVVKSIISKQETLIEQLSNYIAGRV